MTVVVTWIMKKSRLSTLVETGGAGSATVVAALRDAHVQIGDMREEAMAETDAILVRLEMLTRSLTPQDAWLSFDDIYALANSLVDVAGPFGLDDMCAGAFSLCELVDRQKRSGNVLLASILVHVSALRLLRQGDEPAESRAKVLGGLASLLAREPA